MFQFKKIKPSDLNKISPLKEGDQSTFFAMDDAAGGSDTSLTMPHDAYVIGLSSLLSEKEPVLKPAGTRIIEASENKFDWIYDLVPTNDTHTELQVVKDSDYIREYETAFDTILNSPMQDEGYEVRSVKIPALHVDALWLHKEGDDGADVYIPVKTMDLFTENKMYNKETFFGMLKDAAKGYDMNDELLGG